MEFTRLGRHALTICPYCDQLFDWQTDADSGVAIKHLNILYTDHLACADECKVKADAEPSFEDSLSELRADWKEEEPRWQAAIDNHPDNGRDGFWSVEGIRHEAKTRASSAREAIRKCSEVVQSWESPEARFLWEELPEVF